MQAQATTRADKAQGATVVSGSGTAIIAATKSAEGVIFNGGVCKTAGLLDGGVTVGCVDDNVEINTAAMELVDETMGLLQQLLIVGVVGMFGMGGEDKWFELGMVRMDGDGMRRVRIDEGEGGGKGGE